MNYDNLYHYKHYNQNSQNNYYPQDNQNNQNNYYPQDNQNSQNNQNNYYPQDSQDNQDNFEDQGNQGNQDDQNIENMEQSDFLENQQFFPGGTGMPPPPDTGGRPPSTPPGFAPEMQRGGGRPPSEPPNFTPEMPRRGEQQFSGSPDSGVQFWGGGQYRPRNYWGCLNRVTYIWLFNGNNFWFYPTAIGRRQMEGFRWRQGRWVYERINLNRILFFTCF